MISNDPGHFLTTESDETSPKQIVNIFNSCLNLGRKPASSTL